MLAHVAVCSESYDFIKRPFWGQNGASKAQIMGTFEAKLLI